MGDNCQTNSTFSVSYPTRPGQHTDIKYLSGSDAHHFYLYLELDISAAEHVTNMLQLLDLPIEIVQRVFNTLARKHGIPAAWLARGTCSKYPTIQQPHT